MANKTFKVAGLTNGQPAGAAGAPNADAVLDITEKVLAARPSLSTPTVTSQFFSTIISDLAEGKAKYFIDRKANVKINAATDDINLAAGAVTTAGFKTHKRDSFEFTLDGSWETGFIYDKKKDPRVREGELISDLGTLKESLEEEKAALFYEKLKGDIAAKKSTAFAKYAGIDGNAHDSWEIESEITLATAAAADSKMDLAEFQATQLVDEAWNKVEEIAKIGRKGSSSEFFPYARGTRGKLGLKIVVSSDKVTLISKDARFIPTGKGQAIVINGQIGTINNVPVVRDDMFDTMMSSHAVAILPTGAYSPVIVAQELVDSFMLVDHPTRPTRQTLLDGSGGFDAAVTPYINLARFIKVA